MLQLLHYLIHAFQPLVVPLCFVFAWAIVALIGWSLWAAVRDTVVRSQEMHKIPCSECRFFTNDYHLKCTVHPSLCLTEDAINCPDFELGKPQPLLQDSLTTSDRR